MNQFLLGFHHSSPSTILKLPILTSTFHSPNSSSGPPSDQRSSAPRHPIRVNDLQLHFVRYRTPTSPPLMINIHGLYFLLPLLAVLAWTGTLVSGLPFHSAGVDRRSFYGRGAQLTTSESHHSSDYFYGGLSTTIMGGIKYQRRPLYSSPTLELPILFVLFLDLRKTFGVTC